MGLYDELRKAQLLCIEQDACETCPYVRTYPVDEGSFFVDCAITMSVGGARPCIWSLENFFPEEFK